MKQFILILLTCSTVLLAQGQARPPVTGQDTPTEKAKAVVQSDENLDIYPNPSNGVFTISVADLGAKKAELRIMNVIGNEVYRETLTSTDGSFSKTVDLNHYAKGLYYVKLEADNYSEVRRVVVK